ncbi:MAG: HD domain-containing protein [Ardenticatenales bacterium]
MTPRPAPSPLAAARAVLAERGVPGWLVGGVVRDALLGRRSVDVDIAVPSGAVDIGRAIAHSSGGAYVPLAPERGIVRVVWSGRRTRRSDAGVGGGTGDFRDTGDSGRDDIADGVDKAHDSVLDLTDFVGGSLESDLAARDFTINALAVPLDVAADVGPAGLRNRDIDVIDLVGGRADLDSRVVRMVSPAGFDADPLRLLRGPRIAAELGFTLDDATAAAIIARAPTLARPARERVRDELLRMLAVDDAAHWIARLEGLGLLAVVLPDLTACRGVGGADADVLDHSLAVLDAAARLTRRATGDRAATTTSAFDDLVDARRDALRRHWGARIGGRPLAIWFRLAALLHDIGKPACAEWSTERGRWRFPRHDIVGAERALDAASGLRLGADEARYVVAIVRHHLRLLDYPDGTPLSRRDIYHYFQDVGDAGADVALLTAAEVAAKHLAGSSRGKPAGAEATIDALLGAWFDAPEVAVAPQMLLTGDDVMAEFGLPPGPLIGTLLAGLREAQAVGDVATVAEARAWLAPRAVKR